MTYERFNVCDRPTHYVHYFRLESYQLTQNIFFLFFFDIRGKKQLEYISFFVVIFYPYLRERQQDRVWSEQRALDTIKALLEQL